MVKIELVCDMCCKDVFLDGSTPGELRRNARKAGWSWSKARTDAMKDYCPKCVKLQNEAWNRAAEGMGKRRRHQISRTVSGR